MKQILPPLRRGSLSLFALILTALTMQSSPSAIAQNSDDYFRKMARGLELFGEVYREIVEHYAAQIAPDSLAEAGIKGMIATLDRHSVYTSPEAAENASTRRSLRVGIGIEADLLNGILTVTKLEEGYSAQKAGVRVGDRIIAVDGRNIATQPIDTLHSLLRGEVGSTLRLKIYREGVPKEHLFTLTRERIRISSLRYAGMIEEGILFIQLERFGENAGNELRSELVRLLRIEPSSRQVQGILLDLRGNSGGILEEAVRIAEEFVPKGERIVMTDGRDTAEWEVWDAGRDPITSGIPLVLLVDGKTASASELLAAAIQDHDLGVIVGEPTVGKGVVQSVSILPFGASLRLTTAWYITPSGRSIQRVERIAPQVEDGIIPDSLRQVAHAANDHFLPGKITIIPDSLLQVFHTTNGRSVPGGAGIVPDTIVAALPEQSIIPRLDRIGAFFQFASRYTASLDSLPPHFSVDNGTMVAFEEYALDQLLAEEEDHGVIASLDSLQESLAERKHGKRIEKLFEDLTQAIVTDDERAFADEREGIRRVLETTIADRFRNIEQRVRNAVTSDPQIRTAISLLRNAKEYKRLLGIQ